jgi:kinesin family protein 11
LSEEERRVGTPVVVACNDQRREVSVAQNIANKQIDRTFAFDKVAHANYFISLYLLITAT